MTANINQLNHNNIIQEPEVQDVNQEIRPEAGNKPSPEVLKANEETRELLRDILAGYSQIPNPSDDVVAAKTSIQERLAAMNDGVVTLSDTELDRLLNVKRYTNKDGQDPLPAALAHIDECQDYDSVKEQVSKAQDDLLKAYNDKTIDDAELAKGFGAIKDKGDFVNGRIEENAIKQAISKFDMEKTDAPDFVANLESLRTLIADAKFIDFHTKSDLIDGLNDVLKACAKEGQPSESTRKFLRKREEMRAEQQKLMDALINKKNEEKPVNQPEIKVNEIKVEDEIQDRNEIKVGNEIKNDHEINVVNVVKDDQKNNVVNEVKNGQENNVVNEAKDNNEPKAENNGHNNQVPEQHEKKDGEEPKANPFQEGMFKDAEIIEKNDI
ncbi:MAG: hypothetical protein VZR11_10145 [Succinimonas sp.]|nr:hypothetical protein [Succinimonas sp.]